MGITGLIPFLEKCSSKISIMDLKGSTVAVDAYCWLHKGAFSCAELLMRGEETDLYVNYCLKYVNMLLFYDIKPILVFDGQHLPAKALTELRRRESRQRSKKRAAELLRMGRVDEARSHIRRSVDVTHEMALKVIRECRAKNVDCIVAPYEADAQMAWLSHVDIAQYIITEDSDLTLFGARKIIFKLDLTGSGLLVESEKFHLAMGCSKEKYSFKKFRNMCILAGCDYLDSLPGIGLAKACKFILKTEMDADLSKSLKRLPQYLNMRNLEVNDDYIERFLKADATFLHMFIYNPIECRMERLHSLCDYKTDIYFCSNAGVLMDSDQALQLALGNLNPFTLQPLDNWHPKKSFELHIKTRNSIKRKSIWDSIALKDNIFKSSYNEKFPTIINKIDNANVTINSKSSEIKTRQLKNLQQTEEVNNQRKDEKHLPSPWQYKNQQIPFGNERKYLDVQNSIIPCENSSNERSNKKKNSFNEMNGYETNIQSNEFHCDIRSRLFVSNVKVANERHDTRCSADISDVMDTIEYHTKTIQNMQSHLYSQTPIKEVSHHIETSKINYGICNTKTIPSDSTLGNEFAEAEVFIPIKVVNQNEKPLKLVLDVRNDESCLPLNQSSLSSKNQMKDLNTHKTRRCGLTKTKNVSRIFKVNPTTSLDGSQTRLSMFGFKKRMSLKK